MAQPRDAAMSPRKQTPEGLALRAITDYLTLCRLGKVKRRNVGQLRVGDAPTHPWARDTRRIVRFGEPGESDLEVELAGDTRSLFVEVKAPSWHAPQQPKPGASSSTWAKYRHHLDQVAFQERQRARGHFAIFARSPAEVYEQLVTLGFKGLPVPSGCPQDRREPVRTTRRASDVF